VLIATLIARVSPDQPYQMRFRREAAKALRTMPRTGAVRVRAALQRLSENPLRTDLHLRPLRGRAEYRLRVGDVRVLFDRNDTMGVIDVLAIGSRGDIYKR